MVIKRYLKAPPLGPEKGSIHKSEKALRRKKAEKEGVEKNKRRVRNKS